MTRASFRQADIERIIRAARNTGAIVNVDIRTLVCTIIPTPKGQPAPLVVPYVAPDGRENWDDEPHFNKVDEILSRSVRESSPPKIAPFDWRESDAMNHLGKLGADVRVHWREIKNFGPGTQDKLLARGYIGVSFEKARPERRDEVWLTDRGFEDWKALKAHYSRYPAL